MYDDKVYQVALSLIPGIGDILIKQLISYCGDARSVFTTNRGKLSKIPRVGKLFSERMAIEKVLQQAAEELKIAEDKNIQIYFYTDQNYPSRLKQAHNAPSVIYYKGEPVFHKSKLVSIVGSRKATDYGLKVTGDIIEQLSAYQAVVVSGLAYGIDIHAHRTALRIGLPTIGIIAGGINKIYPGGHKKTVEKMLGSGGLLTEQRWDTIPEAHHFPRRNRIIAGISDVTIVVEAAIKGGALITAEYAHAYNRDIFAIPGNLNNRYSEGCNHLIETLKANIYTGMDSLEKVMNWDIDTPKEEIPKKFEQLSANELLILEILGKKNGGMPIDEICWRAQTNINQLASLLLNLEFKGIVRSLPGKMYKIV